MHFSRYLPPDEVGIVSSPRYLMPMVVAPLYGYLADRYGYKTVVSIIALVYALDAALYLIPIYNFWWFLCIYCLGGATGGSLLPLADAYALTLLEKRPELYGQLRMFGSLGRLILGPVSGNPFSSLSSSYLSDQGFTAAKYGMDFNFASKVAINVIMFFIIYFSFSGAKLKIKPDIAGAVSILKPQANLGMFLFFLGTLINSIGIGNSILHSHRSCSFSSLLTCFIFFLLYGAKAHFFHTVQE